MTDTIAFFGELLIRLSAPGRTLLMQTPSLDLHVGGAEANVAIGLSNLGHATRMISAVPDNALGRGAVAAVRGQGVDTSGIITRDGRIGLYFLAPGAGLRASEIAYDRAGSSFATAPADAFDWPVLLAGARRLHLSGITPALGPVSAAPSPTCPRRGEVLISPGRDRKAPALRHQWRGVSRIAASRSVRCSCAASAFWPG